MGNNFAASGGLDAKTGLPVGLIGLTLVASLDRFRSVAQDRNHHAIPDMLRGKPEDRRRVRRGADRQSNLQLNSRCVRPLVEFRSQADCRGNGSSKGVKDVLNFAGHLQRCLKERNQDG